MGRKVVVCCDGTWNDPSAKTNVWRAFDLLRGLLGDGQEARLGSDRQVARGTAADGTPCLLYYDEGVGSQRGQRGSGGLFGTGLGENVRQAYAFLAQEARPDDDLFLIGFSRGAFTVRSLCGMLGCAGLPQAGGATAVDDAWKYYRTTPADRKPRDRYLAANKPRDGFVRFLGVYDTVGSLGVPVPQLGFLNGLIERFFGGVIRFHDTGLGHNVQTACQALAIHERRGTFKPVVWSRAPGQVQRPDGSPVPQQVLQVWFAGAHANVGGGYAVADLSNIPFEWMMRRAIDCGLPLPEAKLAAAVVGNFYGARYDSDRGWLGRVTSGDTFRTVRQLAGSVPLALGPVAWMADLAANLLTVRPVERQVGGETEADDGTYSVAVGERVHRSVTERYRGDYMPAAVARGLAAGIFVFRERADARATTIGQSVRINGVPCPLLDLSRTGARVGRASWLEAGAIVTFARDGKPACRAAVVWLRDDEAGLRLVDKQATNPVAAPGNGQAAANGLQLGGQLLGEQGGAA